MNVVSKYARLVKFSHTIFALPFAMAAYTFALVSTNTAFDWLLLLKILLCMVAARNAAMGFNRWIDRDIDARNSRTAQREIPSGAITPRAALIFVVVNCVVFVLGALWINRLCFYLSFVALVVLLGYSYTKRFTAWSHVVLGCALAIAPCGAYIAVTGTLAMVPVLLSVAVLTWTAGFDILYSLQDRDFDRANNLHSIPARFSPVVSTLISITLHLVTLYTVIIVGLVYPFGWLYWVGTGLFVALLTMQHILYRPSHIDRVGQSFGFVNGAASMAYALLMIADLLVG